MTTRLSADPEQLALARRIRAARLEAGLTQQQVADAIRIGRTAVADIERARRGVDTFEAVRFARVLGVSLEALLDVPDRQAVSAWARQLVAGLTPAQVEQVVVFAEFLLWRRRARGPVLTTTTEGR